MSSDERFVKNGRYNKEPDRDFAVREGDNGRKRQVNR